MNLYDLIQVALYAALLIVAVKPLGAYMARVYEGQRVLLERPLGWLERIIYRAAGVQPDEGMDWKTYARAMLAFNFLGLVFVYLLQRTQTWLPLNPQGLGGVPRDLAFNTAASFASNTNWQSFSGETTLSYLTQLLGLAVQNFVSAATGMAVLVALIRGLRQRSGKTLGNFWADLVRGTLYILLPLSLVLALVLVSQGVVQTFHASETVELLHAATGPNSQAITEQHIALGPAASQIAIKQLGTNGGGFFNVNSAHPFENPTPLTGLLEMLAILLIPAALTYTFGRMVGDTRQGWALLAAMLLIFVAAFAVVWHAEAAGNPAFASIGVAEHPGNMEGKEVRFGIVNSALWATATTAASNGSVNAMHDSFTPVGGLVPLLLIDLGEIVFGGVGSGLYGMLVFVFVAVFIAGLMIGRTPEYLGKKIEAFEMKMAALVILIPAALVLVGAATAVIAKSGVSAVGNPGPHGFSEILYAFSSAGNNNGSAFAGLASNNLFYNLALGIAMLVGRFGVAVPVLAMAGSLASKKVVPAGAGTLPTHTTLFVALLVGVILLVGALTFFPAVALGPVVEQLIMAGMK